MDWDDLKVFLAVYRMGTVAGAAGRLKVSRSTLTRRLESLEAQVGVALVERGADGLRLTDAGEQLLPVAERIEQDAHTAERILAGQGDSLSGRVNLAVFDVGVALVAPLLTELRARHPEIDIRVMTSDRTLNLQRLECDVAIRATGAPDSILVGRCLGVLPYAVFGRPEVVKSETPEWIMWDEARNARKTWALAAKLSAPLRIAARVDTFETMMTLAIEGAGLALLPVPHALRRSELVPWGPVPRDGMGMEVWGLTHPDLRRTPRVRTVLRFLGDGLSPLLERPPERREGTG